MTFLRPVVVSCTAFVTAAAFRVPPAHAETAAFTLDSVLAAPFVDDLTASPKRDALGWTVHERGARNIAVWKAGRVREITHETADDGRELGGIAFVPDASAVVYERGGLGQDGGGINPNPLNAAKREPRKILLTSLASESTIELGIGEEPVVSPKGDRVAWIGSDGTGAGQVMSAAIATRDGGRTWTAQKASALFTVSGTASDPLWSPDGARISVTNDRGDHAYVAIYALGTSRIVYAAPSFASDGSAVWSPDGSQIAFVRLPGNAQTLSFYDPPSARPPWSIAVADAATGAGGVVWTADRGRGSEFFTADGVRPLWWSRDGRLAFEWERDGRSHLYAMPPSGGAPQLLTPGDFDIEQISLGASGNDLVYTSNEGDADARHVWRVAVGGGARGRLTGPEPNQWSPVELARGELAYVNAGAASPGIVTLANGGAPRALLPRPVPSAFPAAALVRPETVVFDAADGTHVHGQMFAARDARATHPALVFVHGGPERQMLATFHYFEAYANLYELTQYLVARGFDVLSVNYRSGIMYGHDFREAPKRGWLGASEYQDVLAGARLLRARRDVDPKRIGIFGLSYGGYLTALSLARNSDIFAAGADQAGISDWSTLIDAFRGENRVGTPEQRATAFAASPLASLATWRSPVYLDQGDDDRNVPFSQNVTLATLLQARGVDVTLHSVPGELHEYTRYENELDRFQRTADFLCARLSAQ